MTLAGHHQRYGCVGPPTAPTSGFGLDRPNVEAGEVQVPAHHASPFLPDLASGKGSEEEDEVKTAAWAGGSGGEV